MAAILNECTVPNWSAPHQGHASAVRSVPMPDVEGTLVREIEYAPTCSRPKASDFMNRYGTSGRAERCCARVSRAKPGAKSIAYSIR